MGADQEADHLEDPSVEDPPPAQESATGDLSARLAEITAERDRLQAEKAELYDKLLRRQADFENLRKRTERERSEFLQYVGMEFAGSVLPVLDDLERALKTETSDAGYVQGIELIYNRLYETLKKMGLEPIETAGRKFDPGLHQAVEQVSTDEVDDHAIVGEFQRGYTFNGKLLRPSMVRVAVRPS